MAAARATETKPSRAERIAIATALRAVAPLADADLDAALAEARVRSIARGAALLRGGERATHTFIVLEGVLREYWLLADGTERTKSFSIEGELIGSLSDLNSRRPSRTSIDALTPARVVAIDFARLVAIAAEREAWLRFFQTMLLRLYLAKSEREWELLALDAAGRYGRFRERFPGIETRVPQRVVASYLGITPVHLSRLRSRAQRERRAAAGRRGSPRARP
jgi:CRP-like cAMP-binding protein